MGWITALLELVRARNAAIAFFGVLVGAALSGNFTLAPVILAAFSAALILAGGNAINDFFDVEVDKTNRPERPIPSGRTSKKSALAVSLILFLLGLAMSSLTNAYCLIIAAANTVVLILYGRFSKI